MDNLLEKLKKRYMSAPLEGKQLLRDNLIALAAACGKEQEIQNFIEQVDGGRINSLDDLKVAQEEEKMEEMEGEEVKKEEMKERVEELERGEVGEEPEIKKEVEQQKTDLQLQKINDNINEVLQRLEQINKTLQEHETALKEHKRVLEHLLQEEEEEEEKEPKVDEFGVRFSSDLEDLNENKKYANIRRIAMVKEQSNKELSPTERRKARLQKFAQEEAPKSLKEFYNVEKDIEKMKKLPRIPETPYTTKEQLEKRKEEEKEKIKTRVWDLSRLAAELTDDEQSWIVSYEGKPIYAINYKDNENRVEKDEFVSTGFGKGLLKTLALNGEEELQKKFNITVLGEPKEEEEKEEKKEKEKEKEKEAAYEIKFERAWRLANAVLMKNLSDNPLKGALFEIFSKKAELKNPVPYIEEAFRMAADKYFDTMMSLTKKYMNLDDKTIAEVEEFVKSARTQVANLDINERTDLVREMEAQELRRRAEAGSIPLVSSDFVREDPLRSAMPKPLNWYNIK